MELHHEKHHRGYVGNDNLTITLLEEARATEDYTHLAALEQALAFNTQIHDHQSKLSHGGVPLMVIDAWEHAYYLQYQNQKSAFFEAVWHLWNWTDIAERLAAARGVNLLVPGSARKNF